VSETVNVVVRTETCTGSGGCRRVAPEVFGSDADGWVQLLDEHPTGQTEEALQASEICLHAAPMFHLADIATWTAGCLIGSTHVMVPTFTAAAVTAAITEHEITDMLLVPTMIQLVVDDPDAAERDLSSLQHLLNGASPISEAARTGP
jgi:acyl-CoA synthetase (AMP-forming)/AMP-acid ligase II